MPQQPLILWASLDPAYTGPPLVSFTTPAGQTFHDLTFVDAAAQATGLAPAAIRRLLRIAEDITPELLIALKEAPTPIPALLEASTAAPDQDALTHAWEEASDAERHQFLKSLTDKGDPS